MSATLLLLVVLSCPESEPVVAASAPVDTEAFVAALTDRDPDVRALAAGLLGEARGEPKVTEALRARLTDEAESWRVRAAAAGSLGRLARAPSDHQALWTVAATPGTDWRVRADSLQALWAMDDGRTLGRLLRRHEAALVIGNGASELVLTSAGPPGSDDALRALRNRDPRMRDLACLALQVGLGPSVLSREPVEAGPTVSAFGLIDVLLGPADGRAAASY